MKSKLLILIIFALISTTTNAADYIPVKLIDTNGKEQTGYAKRIGANPVKHVLFKATKNAKKQRIPSDNLKKIIYSYPDAKVEYDRLRMYNRPLSKKPSKKMYWVKVIKRDYLTIYYVREKAQNHNMNPHLTTRTEGGYWVFYREGEDAATIVSLGKVLNGNSVFRFSAQRYFKDYPELAAKIKKKEYKWKDIDEVAELYNKWYAKKTN